MGIKIEFNLGISQKLVNEINAERATLGIKSFEYSSQFGLIEFNDNVTQTQADQRLALLFDKLVRKVSS